MARTEFRNRLGRLNPRDPGEIRVFVTNKRARPDDGTTSFVDIDPEDCLTVFLSVSVTLSL